MPRWFLLLSFSLLAVLLFLLHWAEEVAKEHPLFFYSDEAIRDD